MGSVRVSFFLSLFALWAQPAVCSAASRRNAPIPPSSLVEDARASYATLEELNGSIQPFLEHLVTSSDFFSHYRLNLFHKRCPFWDDENGMCGNIGCAVETLENEDEVPEVWRAKELSKLEGPLAKHPGKKEQRQRPARPLQGKLGESVGESCVVEYDDECDERDYCVLEDESAASKGDYVSLLRNPERFTGYGGEGAKQVWDAIYRENCFQKSSFSRSADLGSSSYPAGSAAWDFKHVIDTAGRHARLQQYRLQNPGVAFVASTGHEVDDECLEKRVFHRVMSGMHASISAHLCWNFLNQTTGEWQPNFLCYARRLHEHPERISNLYFNFALVTRAVAKLEPSIRESTYTYCTGDRPKDEATRGMVLAVTRRAASVSQIFDESLMFVNGEGPSLKEDFRNRFRNVSRLMDCVGCDKCRLWGKIQTNGYGTALKVLFESDDRSGQLPNLKRTEMVALFNTYARLSHSLSYVQQFQTLLQEEASESTRKPPQAGAESISSSRTTKQGDAVADPDDVGQDEALLELNRLRSRGPQSNSWYDQAVHELEQFQLAIRIVINGWLRAPQTFWHIMCTEFSRLWQFWVGLPVTPRQWKIRFPDVDGRDL